MDAITLAKPKVRKAPLKWKESPSLYQVVLLNDDYTPMEFVVGVIQTVFGYDLEKSTRIMMQVHYDGQGICGVYARDVAETKVSQVIEMARQANHPLMCKIELQP